MSDRHTEYVLVRGLKELHHPENPKDHDLGRIHGAIERFGFTIPILLCERVGKIAAGHGRSIVLDQREKNGSEVPDGIRLDDEGRWLAPVIRGWASKDDLELKAYLIADNRLTELGGWDEAALAEMLAELNDGPGLHGVGFDLDDIERMLKGSSWHDKWKDREAKEDAGDATDVQVGDIWRVGGALIACGDSTDQAVWSKLLDGEQADLLLTDPPYGIAYSGGAGAAREAIDNDELTADQLMKLIEDALFLSIAHMRAGATSYIFAPTGRELLPVLKAIDTVGLFRWSLVWAKDRLIPSRADFNMQHETIIHGKKGDTTPPSAHEFMVYGWKEGAAHRKPFDPEGSLSTVWDGVKPAESKYHATQKPTELLGRAIDLSTQMGDLILDPFAGSGSTLVAAVERGRTAVGIELEPVHVAAVLERLEIATGGTRELIERMEIAL